MSSYLWSGLWGLVNNAGVLGHICEVELLPMRILRKILNVNFTAGVEVTKVFLPLIRQAQGRVVCVSSMSGMLLTSLWLTILWLLHIYL